MTLIEQHLRLLQAAAAAAAAAAGVSIGLPSRDQHTNDGGGGVGGVGGTLATSLMNPTHLLASAPSSAAAAVLDASGNFFPPFSLAELHAVLLQHQHAAIVAHRGREEALTCSLINGQAQQVIWQTKMSEKVKRLFPILIEENFSGNSLFITHPYMYSKRDLSVCYTYRKVPSEQFELLITTTS